MTQRRNCDELSMTVHPWTWRYPLKEYRLILLFLTTGGMLEDKTLVNDRWGDFHGISEIYSLYTAQKCSSEDTPLLKPLNLLIQLRFPNPNPRLIKHATIRRITIPFLSHTCKDHTSWSQRFPHLTVYSPQSSPSTSQYSSSRSLNLLIHHCFKVRLIISDPLPLTSNQRNSKTSIHHALLKITQFNPYSAMFFWFPKPSTSSER